MVLTQRLLLQRIKCVAEWGCYERRTNAMQYPKAISGISEKMRGSHQSPRVIPDRIAKESSTSAAMLTSSSIAVAITSILDGCGLTTRTTSTTATTG